MNQRPAPPPLLWLVLAVGAEIAALVLAAAPAGSLLAPGGVPKALAHAGVLGASILLLSLGFRLSPGGPRARDVFYSAGGASPAKSLYYGVLAAILLTAYRAALALAATFMKTPLTMTLSGDNFGYGPFGLFAVVASSLFAAFLFFGFVRATAGGVLGPRAGVIVAAALAAVAVTWPLGQPALRLGAIGPWVILAAWTAPAALALAYLAQRAGNVIAPLTAVFMMEWFAAVGVALHAAFGKWPFYFAAVLILAAAIEVLIVERRRWTAAAAAFFRLLAARGEPADVLDGALFAAALLGIFVLARASAFLEWEFHWRVVPVGVGIIAAVAFRLAATRKPKPRPPGDGDGQRSGG